MTRPDISYAVSAVSQFMSNPTLQHMTAGYRVLRYIKGTKHYSLKYYKCSEQNSVSLYAYCDSNFMGDHDSRSVGGYIFMSTCGIVHWVAKRLSTVSTSTGHAETQAFFMCAKENVHLRSVATELPISTDGVDHPTTVFCDSSVCMELVRKECGVQQRTKHWKLNWNWLHEQRESLHSYTPVKIDGTCNPSDMGTKPLVAATLQKHVKMLKLCGGTESN